MLPQLINERKARKEIEFYALRRSDQRRSFFVSDRTAIADESEVGSLIILNQYRRRTKLEITNLDHGERRNDCAAEGEISNSGIYLIYSLHVSLYEEVRTKEGRTVVNPEKEPSHHERSSNISFPLTECVTQCSRRHESLGNQHQELYSESRVVGFRGFESSGE